MSSSKSKSGKLVSSAGTSGRNTLNSTSRGSLSKTVARVVKPSSKAVATAPEKKTKSTSIKTGALDKSTKSIAPDSTLVVIPSGTTPFSQTPLAIPASQAPSTSKPTKDASATVAPEPSSSNTARGSKRMERESDTLADLLTNNRSQKHLYKPTTINLFPTLPVIKPLPPSRSERAQLRYLKEFRSRVRNGPLYAMLTEDAKIGSKRAAAIDPFEDVDHYTKKFKQEPRALAKFDTRKYHLGLFPEELRGVIRPETSRALRKSINANKSRKISRLEKGQIIVTATQAAAGRDIDDQEPTNSDSDGEVQDPDEDALSETNVDDDFEDNESEMAGDYNAEGYFDTGDGDGDSLDGQGGGNDGGGFD